MLCCARVKVSWCVTWAKNWSNGWRNSVFGRRPTMQRSSVSTIRSTFPSPTWLFKINLTAYWLCRVNGSGAQCLFSMDMFTLEVARQPYIVLYQGALCQEKECHSPHDKPMRHTITLKLRFDDAVFKISPSSLKEKKITVTLAQFSKCSKNITPELLLVIIPQWKSTKSSSWLLSTRSTRWVEVTESVAALSWTESFSFYVP